MRTLAALPLVLFVVVLTAGQLQDKIMSSETTEDYMDQSEESLSTSQSPLSLSRASVKAEINTQAAMEVISKDSMEDPKPKFDKADRASKATSFNLRNLKDSIRDSGYEVEDWLAMMLFSAPTGDNRPVQSFPNATKLPFPDLSTLRMTPKEMPTRETTPATPTKETTSETPKRETTPETSTRETTPETPTKETTSETPRRGTTPAMSTRGLTPEMPRRKTTPQKVRPFQLWSTVPWINHPAKTIESVPKSSTTDEGLEIDDEYEEDEFGIYTFAHFRHELYHYVNEKLSAINVTLVGELRRMQEKLTRVEDQLSKNIAYTQLLESQIKTGKNLKRGDLRLVVAGKEILGAKFGYLQYYTGAEWGFVCDDFFNAAAQKVACKQLGLTAPSATFRTASTLPEGAAGESSVQNSWKKQFSIALDDVICSGSEENLDSCYHSDVGKHDCSLDEIVFLVC